MLRGSRHVVLLVVLAVLTAACDKAQLLAPTKSTITLSAPTRVLPSNGSAPVTATVIEQAGTPVQNGTTVRFTTTLGRVEPVEVQTVNGLAITTFFAGPNSGIAEVRGISGAATGGTTTSTGGTTTTDSSVIRITVGAAAVNTVSVRANPGSIGPNGGSVELIANVVGENGQPLEGVVVTFNTDQGSLASPTATTNANGEARTTLTTSQRSSVTVTAGTKTSTPATVIDVRPGPNVTIACSFPSGGTGATCANVTPTTSNNTATVAFTITRAALGATSSPLRSATIDFGDGTSENLGNLSGGTATVTHAYAGTTTSNPRSYTATVTATDINGETQTASTTVILLPRPTPTPMNVAVSATSGAAGAGGQRWEFTATVTGGGESGTGNAVIERYEWDFGDGESATTSSNITSHIYDTDPVEQRRIVTVTARTPDGRTASGRIEILVAKFP